VIKKITISIPILLLFLLIIYISRPLREIHTIAVPTGKLNEDVIRDSTFPVKSKTLIRPTTPPVEDSTWFSSPVIVNFDDPQHGFILPPTKFGAVGYNSGKVTTITTSPMLKTLPFSELIPLINDIQEMLKKAGWIPEDDNENYTWIKVGSEAEKNALQSLLFDHAVTVTLLIPHKYGLSLIVKCYARCSERDPETARYLIDVSVGEDFSQ